ncbi:MAG: hypothetical protein KKB34_19610 [Bacteroidetes bacterium]|jgi:hypothetical protein|nr:hypothetical protein [Bacteroidota bacterium]
MELIPILSLIILVATISTFILAVGAYILYKVRENKSRQAVAQPSTVQAELISPMPIMTEQTMSRTRGYTADRYPTRESYQEPIYAPAQDGVPQMRPTFVNPPQADHGAPESQRYQYQRTVERPMEYDRQTAARKFTRYTTAEHNQEAKRTKSKQDEKDSLRWR